MSNDFINRKAVVEIIDELGYVNCYDEKAYRSNSRVDKIRQKVIELPAAYDTDKAAEQIEKTTRPGQPEYYLDGRPVIYKDQAIEIIRTGGRQQER